MAWRGIRRGAQHGPAMGQTGAMIFVGGQMGAGGEMGADDLGMLAMLWDRR